MTRLLVAIFAAVLGLAASQPVAAEPHKLMVLQSEGRVDAATRAKIDAAILRLALTSEPQAAPGELTFSDAATAVGCKPDAPTCKDEVLGMLGVDEIVTAALAPKPGGIELTVRRVTRGGATREATTLLASGAPDKLDGIAPLFGANAAPAAGPPAPAAPAPAPAPAVTATERPVEESPTVPAPNEVAPPAPSPVTRPTPAEPSPPIDASSGRRRRWELTGMIGGGGMVLLGFVLWAAASSAQGDIDDAPATTAQDIAHLRDLETKGDTYAALGNVFAIGGVVLGGVSTYLYIRDRRDATAASARLTPTVLDHGVGVVLTIGGSP